MFGVRCGATFCENFRFSTTDHDVQRLSVGIYRVLTVRTRMGDVLQCYLGFSRSGYSWRSLVIRSAEACFRFPDAQKGTRLDLARHRGKERVLALDRPPRAHVIFGHGHWPMGPDASGRALERHMGSLSRAAIRDRWDPIGRRVARPGRFTEARMRCRAQDQIDRRSIRYLAAHICKMGGNSAGRDCSPMRSSALVNSGPGGCREDVAHVAMFAASPAGPEPRHSQPTIPPSHFSRAICRSVHLSNFPA